MFTSFYTIIYAILALAMLITLTRLLRGPCLPDRMVALEMLSSQVIAMASIHAIETNQVAYLDIAIVMALTAFLSAIGIAKFIQLRGAGDD